MGLFNRMSTIIKAKMSKIADNAEDPRETLDYSYEKQLELLQKIKEEFQERKTKEQLMK